MGKQVHAGPRLDRLPMTKRHYSILMLLAGGGFFDGFDIYLAGSVLASMVAMKFSTVAGNASFISSTFFGLLFGTLIAAALGDRLGRKFTLKYSLLVYGIFTILCAIAPSFGWLIAFRAIAGLGLGSVIVVGYGMWVEFTPKHTRGFWTGALSFLINLSQPAAALVALYFIPDFGWRVMFWIAGIPPILVWALQVRYLPESPRWLEEKGKSEEAEKVLVQFEKHVKDLPPATVYSQAAKSQRKKVISLWSPGIRTITLLSIIISTFTMTTWYTFTAWIPTFFIKQGFSEVKTFTFSLVIMLGAIPGNALAAWLMDRVGRKYTLAVISLLLGIIAVMYGGSKSPVEIMTLGFIYVMGGNILIAVILASYIPELFPTSIRMTGSSLANAFGRAGTIVSPYLIAYLFTHGGQNAVFWSSCAMYVIMALAILFLGRETKQMSLEEIEKEEIMDNNYESGTKFI
ncbi:MFS transporter [Aneurinibacillus sp. Ricciae_BoGa-3]|uniref:MFS transporter n=1 Tax=Aneurinibacillus sp. Ricciae_BoGa-3 TaxID=3022697 RepID=UPI002342657D|nr:MFS transporter [Aneurinibacillus sp. Ricciae_BoGa-3]WCK55256.1 MFS transporter [Aneurinibacillus sp. Ricciae_BoGa-3]